MRIILTITIHINVTQVTQAITISIFLIRIVDTWAIVTGIPKLVRVNVFLLAVGNRGAIVLLCKTIRQNIIWKLFLVLVFVDFK